eukprot:2698364-Rhodomonas_salina.2
MPRHRRTCRRQTDTPARVNTHACVCSRHTAHSCACWLAQQTQTQTQPQTAELSVRCSAVRRALCSRQRASSALALRRKHARTQTHTHAQTKHNTTRNTQQHTATHTLLPPPSCSALTSVDMRALRRKAAGAFSRPPFQVPWGP